MSDLFFISIIPHFCKKINSCNRFSEGVKFVSTWEEWKWKNCMQLSANLQKSILEVTARRYLMRLQNSWQALENEF